MMDSTLLADALAAATETRDLVEGPDAFARLPELFTKHFPGRTAVIVAASDTWEAAGVAVDRVLRDAGVPLAEAYVFPIPPFLHADYRHIATLRDSLAASGAVPVSVGSGTVNDLVKRAASEAGTRYLSVATAASVDGYTSSGAAILKDGFKQTLPCPAPLAVIVDPGVLARAPLYLTSSGYGDLASKIIAGTDWLIADAAGADPVNPYAFRLTQSGLRERLSRPDAVRAGDPDAILALFEGLAMTGFSMQYLKSSRPVSGCEHLFSHIWEMEDLQFAGRPVTHGHKVAIGTLAATALTEVMLRRGLGSADPGRCARALPAKSAREVQVRDAFSGSPAAPGAVEAAVKTAVGKLSPEGAATRISRFRDAWDALAPKLRAQLMPYAELRDALSRAGCPVRPEDVGLAREYAIRTAFRAQMIRNRYGVLDLEFELGILADCVDEVLADGRYLR